MKKIIILFVVIAIASLIYFFFDKNEPSPQSPHTSLHVEQPSLSKEVVELEKKDQQKQDEKVEENKDELDQYNISQQTKDCIRLRQKFPDEYQFYLNFISENGINSYDLMFRDEYTGLSQPELTQLSKSGDVKAQYILGVEYVWEGAYGMDFFGEMTGSVETTPEYLDKLKNHKLDHEMVLEGQRLLFEAASNGLLLKLPDVVVGQRLIVNKIKWNEIKKHDEGKFNFEEEYFKYLALVNLVDYVFTGETKSFLKKREYSIDETHKNIAETLKPLDIDITLPENKRTIKRLSEQYINQWKSLRYDKGYLNTQLQIPRYLEPYIKEFNEKCPKL